MANSRVASAANRACWERKAAEDPAALEQAVVRAIIGDKPLPRKLVITNRSDEARPQSVQMFDWNLKPGFKDSVFKFTPPKGATAVELRSLEQK